MGFNHFLIEGDDGSGKDAIIREVTKRLADKGVNILIVKTTEGNKELEEVLRDSKSTVEQRFLAARALYELSMERMMTKLRNLGRRGQGVDGVIYYRGLGGFLSYNTVAWMGDELQMRLLPDYRYLNKAIYIECTLNERLRRIKCRKPSRPSLQDTEKFMKANDGRLREKFFKVANFKGIETTVVDNTSNLEQAVMDTIKCMGFIELFREDDIWY